MTNANDRFAKRVSKYAASLTGYGDRMGAFKAEVHPSQKTVLLSCAGGRYPKRLHLPQEPENGKLVEILKQKGFRVKGVETKLEP